MTCQDDLHGRNIAAGTSVASAIYIGVGGGRSLPRLVVMFCGAYDYEPFVVYGNDVLNRRRRRHPGWSG